MLTTAFCHLTHIYVQFFWDYMNVITAAVMQFKTAGIMQVSIVTAVGGSREDARSLRFINKNNGTKKGFALNSKKQCENGRKNPALWRNAVWLAWVWNDASSLESELDRCVGMGGRAGNMQEMVSGRTDLREMPRHRNWVPTEQGWGI